MSFAKEWYYYIGVVLLHFNFNIVNFPFLSSNIPSLPAYGFFVSQLVRYSRSSSDYSDFIKRGSILVERLTKQGFPFLDWNMHLKNSMVVIRTLLENMIDLCLPLPKIYLVVNYGILKYVLSGYDKCFMLC